MGKNNEIIQKWSELNRYIWIKEIVNWIKPNWMWSQRSCKHSHLGVYLDPGRNGESVLELEPKPEPWWDMSALTVFIKCAKTRLAESKTHRNTEEFLNTYIMSHTKNMHKKTQQEQEHQPDGPGISSISGPPPYFTTLKDTKKNNSDKQGVTAITALSSK